MRRTFCNCCLVFFDIATGAYNRAIKRGAPLYCGRECAGLARRANRSDEQRRKLKADYDRQRRTDLADELKAAKREYHLRTYDPVKAAAERKAKMPRHVEYCRRPKYREYKRGYDRQHRAKKHFGPFWECQLILMDLEGEIDVRADRTEIYRENGRFERQCEKRKRAYAKSYSGQSEIGPLGNLERNPSRSAEPGASRRNRLAGSGNSPHHEHAASDFGADQARRPDGRDQVQRRVTASGRSSNRAPAALKTGDAP